MNSRVLTIKIEILRLLINYKICQIIWNYFQDTKKIKRSQSLK